MIIQGKTGAYIKYLMRKALTKAALFGALTVGAVAIILLNEPAKIIDGGFRAVAAVLLIVIAIFAFNKMKKAYASYSRAAIGLKSEQRVAKELKRSGVEGVVHGPILNDRTGDADHVVLGPVCLVIETKTGTGNVSVEGDKVIAGRRTIPKSPIRQAARQAEELGRKLNTQANAIVCVVDMKNAPFKVNNVWVCSLKDLNAVISRCPQILSPRQVKNALEVLK